MCLIGKCSRRSWNVKMFSSLRSRSPLTAVIPVRYSTGEDNIEGLLLICFYYKYNSKQKIRFLNLRGFSVELGTFGFTAKLTFTCIPVSNRVIFRYFSELSRHFSFRHFFAKQLFNNSKFALFFNAY